MTQNQSEIVRYEPLEATPVDSIVYGAEPAEEDGGSPFLKIHKLLLGRYKYAVTLAILLAAMGGYFAYNFKPALYRSTGVIRIRPYVPKVIYNSDESGVMPMFDAFAAWQAELIRSQRVVTMAQESDAWRESGRGISPDERSDFKKSLQVTREPEAHLIYVSFEDPDPEVAAAGAKSVVEAYMRSYGESDVERDSRRLRVLEDRRTALNSELSSLRKRILAVGNQYGSDRLEDNYKFKLSRLHELETALKETEIALATTQAELIAFESEDAEGEDGVVSDSEAESRRERDALNGEQGAQVAAAESRRNDSSGQGAGDGEAADSRAVAAQGAPDGDEAVASAQGEASPEAVQAELSDMSMQPDEMSVEDIAVVDGALRQMLDQRESIHRRISGLKPVHPARIEAEEDLVELERMIASRADAVRRVRLSAEQPEEDGQNPLELRIAGLEERHRRLAQLFDDAKAETMELGRAMLQIGNLQKEMDNVQRRLNETNFRMEELNVESSASGRVEVVSVGDVPMLPANDDRRRQLGVIGGLGSAACGFGLILAVSLIDPRLRRSDDRMLDGTGVDLLGMLPELSDDVANADDATLAAHCVHQVRNLLQIQSQRNGHKVLTITSPVPGTGKSSVVLSLGLSLAAANARVLMIDSDFAGCGLSRRIAAINHKKIGQHLVDRGMITIKQLKAAKAAAQASGRQLTTELVLAGSLSDDDLDEALNLRERIRHALVDGNLITQKQFDKIADRVGSSNDSLRVELVRRRLISRNDLEKALDFPEFQSLGMIDALSGAPLDECIAETGIPNLWMVPTGEAESHDMNRIAPPDIRRIFREARDRFDFVLVDTGPLGGDVGTAILATEADGALLVLSRNEGRREAEQAIHTLEAINAVIEGVVFNRADINDIERSNTMGISSLSGASAISGRSRRPNHENDYREFFRHQAARGVGRRAAGFGPIAKSVVCTGSIRRTTRTYDASLDAKKALPSAN